MHRGGSALHMMNLHVYIVMYASFVYALEVYTSHPQHRQQLTLDVHMAAMSPYASQQIMQQNMQQHHYRQQQQTQQRPMSPTSPLAK